jgi:hypothetical protein
LIRLTRIVHLIEKTSASTAMMTAMMRSHEPVRSVPLQVLNAPKPAAQVIYTLQRSAVQPRVLPEGCPRFWRRQQSVLGAYPLAGWVFFHSTNLDRDMDGVVENVALLEEFKK